jgi:peptidylprolyl isomerase
MAEKNKSKTRIQPAHSAAADKAGKEVAAGSKVLIEYVGSFEDGKIFDSSIMLGKPIEFVVGSGQVIKGFDKAVLGLKVGEESTVKLLPAEAYGEYNKEFEKIILRKNLPADREPKEGMALLLGLSNGKEIPARVTKVNGDMVTLDLNHPLAGKTLNFKIKVVGIN